MSKTKQSKAAKPKHKIPRAKAAEKKPERFHLTDAEFWAMVRENAGNYARIARAIEVKFKIPYSRQAVKQRVDLNPELLEDILEESNDIAEEVFLTIMRTGKAAERLKAAEAWLKAKASRRGWAGAGLQAKLDLPGKPSDPDQPGAQELPAFTLTINVAQ